MLGPPSWFSDRLRLAPDLIHVVHVRLDSRAEGGIEILDDTERDRASRFISERDRRRFVVAHQWVRILLGRCLARSPESLRFVRGPRGKPALLGAGIDVKFNLSHTAERALLAIALGREVGVDIEREREVDVSELAGRVFAPSEAAALRMLCPAERISAFFRCWTRKEAFIKALGDGLAFPLDGFDVSISNDRAYQLLLGINGVRELPLPWRVVSLLSEPGYAAALATTAGDWRILRWEASPSTPLASVPEGPHAATTYDAVDKPRRPRNQIPGRSVPR
jgi:4'-phosphopantetheinyl transferase